MGKGYKQWQRQFHPVVASIFARAEALSNSESEPRKHHLVPKFYLERWAKNGQLRVTDFHQDRYSYTTSPSNVARETDFYRFEEETIQNMSPVVWEVFLSEIEDRAAPIIKKMHDRGLNEISDSDGAVLLMFISFQITRSRSFRLLTQWTVTEGHQALFERAGDDYLRQLLTKNGFSETPEHVNRLRQDLVAFRENPDLFPMNRSEQIALSGKSARDLAPMLFKRKFVLYRTFPRLVTCDQPVVELYEDMCRYPHQGGIEGAPILVFPLGPDLVLSMFREDQPILLDPSKELTSDETLELNRAILGNSDRLAFEQSDLHITEKLYVPEKPPPGVRHMVGRSEDGREIHRLRPGRRWVDDPLAPLLPVVRWWSNEDS